jgi:hypothetical protein
MLQQERRNYPRFTTAVKVQDLVTLKTGLTDNISLGGCFVQKSQEFDFLPVSSRITLKFDIPGISETVMLFGLVMHRGRQAEGFGIQFQDVHKKSAYYIGRFMGSFL